MKNLGKFSEEQFNQMFKKSETQNLGVMTDAEFGQLKNQSEQFSQRGMQGTQPQDVLLSPGSTLVEPGLKKLVVSSKTAFGIGFAADLAIPGPGGEAKRGIDAISKHADDVVKLGSEIMDKMTKTDVGIMPLVDRLAKLTLQEDKFAKLTSKKSIQNAVEKILDSDIYKDAWTALKSKSVVRTPKLFSVEKLDGGQEAINKLVKQKSGEIRGALRHPEIGEIDLVWGGNNYGLAHIKPEIRNNLAEIISRSKLVEKGPTRAFLETPDHRSVIVLDWKGEPKKWVLTAYEKK